MTTNSQTTPCPIVVKKRRLACENRMWRVYFDNIVEEGGAEIADYMVLESKAFPMKPRQITGAAVLPVVNGDLGLINIYRHAIGETVWEVPRGFIDIGEDAAVSASRELEEETGLRCPPERLMPLGYLSPEAGTIAGKAALFAAIDCETGGQKLDTEIGLGVLRFFPIEDVLGMANTSEIEDAGTLALIYRYASARGR